jgi:dihydroorotate dehydrogenase (NAD+) catalytic subunit
MLLAGASAVQVGTATLADPLAPARVLAELRQLLEAQGIASVTEIIGAAHRSGYERPGSAEVAGA